MTLKINMFVTCSRYVYLQGNERLPILSHGSERDTGFTHETATPVFYGKAGEVRLENSYTSQLHAKQNSP